LSDCIPDSWESPDGWSVICHCASCPGCSNLEYSRTAWEKLELLHKIYVDGMGWNKVGLVHNTRGNLMAVIVIDAEAAQSCEETLQALPL
jgi:hypothetical protein